MIKRDSTPLGKQKEPNRQLSCLLNENRTLKKPEALKVIPWLKPVNLRKISIQILLNNSDFEGNELVQDQQIISRDGVDGIDLGKIITAAMEKYDINSDAGVQVDYWSNMSQTYVLCGCLDPTISESAIFLPEDELCQKQDGTPYLVLRFKNSTGNIINFFDSDIEVTDWELSRAKAALSVDYRFKNQRRRSVAQAIMMAFRQRQVSSGYYDFMIKRWVQSLTLEQAANNLDVRHKIVTQENQHIEKKTLDDYWSFIKLALDPKNPFDF